MHNFKAEKAPSSFMKVYIFEDPTLPVDHYKLNKNPVIGLLTEPLI